MAENKVVEEYMSPHPKGPHSERKRKISVSSGPNITYDQTPSRTPDLLDVGEMLQNEFETANNNLLPPFDSETCEPSQKKKSFENRSNPFPPKVSVTFADERADFEDTATPGVRFADIYNSPKDPPDLFKASSRTTVITRKKSTGKLRRRVIDEEGFVRRVACVCVNDSESQILLVSSKKDSTSWMFPGGGIDATELESEAAKREAWEEAGVRGRISRRLGLFESTHPSGLKKHRTSVYVYTITAEEDDFPEAYLGRKRRWFAPPEALKILSHQRPLQSLYLKSLH